MQYTRQASTLLGTLKCGGFFHKGAGLRYSKLPLSFEQQAQLLLDRGLVADKAELVQRLAAVNYYRLSAYWYMFKRVNPSTGDESFAPNTTLALVWRRYVFDRELRR